MDALVLPISDQLPEHGRPAAISGGVADVGLVGLGVGGVQLELIGVGQVGEGRFEALHVGPVAEFGHGEASGERSLHRAGKEGLVMPGGAEVRDRPAEQAVLDA